jgi:hypothetical protein
MKNIRSTFVHRVPSATFHYTLGDKKVYLDFVDRDATISYNARTAKGKKLIDYIKRRGQLKVTTPRAI